MYTPLNSIRNCKICRLCENQKPLIQNCVTADIIWVGLSAVKAQDNSEIPLSSKTNTGKLIESVEQLCPSKSFYRTNLVKCLPLDNDKIRYPSTSEMKNCFPNLKDEIQLFKPKLIFLLGKQVATFVLRSYNQDCPSLDDQFEYKSIVIGNSMFVPVHHPSFILVYKRKKMADYIQSLARIVNSNQSNSKSYNETILSIDYSGFPASRLSTYATLYSRSR